MAVFIKLTLMPFTGTANRKVLPLFFVDKEIPDLNVSCLVFFFLEKRHKADTIHRLLCSIHFGTAASELVCKLNNSACFSKGFTPPGSGVGISEYASRIGERSANTKQNPFVLIALL